MQTKAAEWALGVRWPHLSFVPGTANLTLAGQVQQELYLELPAPHQGPWMAACEAAGEWLLSNVKDTLETRSQ